MCKPFYTTTLASFDDTMRLSSGYIALADLDPDDGQFHTDTTGVFHDGLDRGWLQQRLEEAGFIDVKHTTVSRMVKPVAGGGSREFTIFLMTARKK